MTSEDRPRPGPDDLPVSRDLPEDGPLIDPRDPLGLGDVPGAGTDEDDTSTASSVVPSDPGTVTGPEPAPDPERAPDPEPADEVDAAAPGDEPAPDDRGTPQDDADDPDEEGTGDDAGQDAAVRDAGDDGSDRAPAPDVPPAKEEPAVGAAVRPARSGWARLGHAMRPRTTQGQLITAGLCALLGFALVVQVRQTTETQLGALRQNDLVRLLDETTTRTDELEQESLDLQRERDELLSGSDRQQAALDAARRTAEMQGILTGRLPATGPGVRITLTEPNGEIRPATMLHVLEELRNAGAEAMELNDQRITASSSFTGTRGAVLLDGRPLSSPFRWTVIGDPDTIAPALEIPGGALVRVRADGGRATVEKSDKVDVTAIRSLPDPVHATPVGDGD